MTPLRAHECRRVRSSAVSNAATAALVTGLPNLKDSDLGPTSAARSSNGPHCLSQGRSTCHGTSRLTRLGERPASLAQLATLVDRPAEETAAVVRTELGARGAVAPERTRLVGRRRRHVACCRRAIANGVGRAAGHRQAGRAERTATMGNCRRSTAFSPGSRTLCCTQAGTSFPVWG